MVRCQNELVTPAPVDSLFSLLSLLGVLDSRVAGGIEDTLTVGFPADAVVLVAGLAEHLQDLPDAPSLADTPPLDNDEITDAPSQPILRLCHRSPPFLDFPESQPTVRPRTSHQRRVPLIGLGEMHESCLTPRRPL